VHGSAPSRRCVTIHFSPHDGHSECGERESRNGPCEVVGRSEAAVKPKQPIPVPPDFPPVLIIDDAATNRPLAVRQLARLGLSSDSAQDGLEGLEKATSRNCSLILVDGSMPLMDGPTFAQRYREFEKSQGRPRLPLVAMTAHALRGDAERLTAAGMDDYLPKPVTLDRLEAILYRWLNLASAPQAAPVTTNASASEAPVNVLRMMELQGLEDPAGAAELLGVFASELPTLLERISLALAAEVRSALARAMHATKGAAASAAAQHLYRLLADMEEVAKSVTCEQLTSRFEQVQVESGRVRAAIAKLAATTGTDAKSFSANR
jgi:two-component system sensor histidine kinase/response regulator